MTVEELIEKLMEFPLDAEVVKAYSVPYEDGDGYWEEYTEEVEPCPSLVEEGKVWI